jgi:hypothetical protein
VVESIGSVDSNRSASPRAEPGSASHRCDDHGVARMTVPTSAGSATARGCPSGPLFAASRRSASTIGVTDLEVRPLSEEDEDMWSEGRSLSVLVAVSPSAVAACDSRAIGDVATSWS